MTAEKITKNNQEQALASWVNYLNQIRLDELINELHSQDQNLFNALKQMKWAEIEIDKTIVSNRGGDTGIHGFLAEILETGVNNARRLIDGKNINVEWCNDNDAVDLIRDGVGIQQKFYQSDGLFSLNAAEKHLKHYPYFLKNGMKYQIPKDQYEKVRFLTSLSEKEAYQQLNSTSEPTIAQWRKVNTFFKNSDLKVKDFEPSHLKYDQVQKGKASETIIKEKENLYSIDKKNRETIYQKSKPSLSQGAKVTIISSATEGITTLCLEISKKRKEKKISDFSSNDWNDVIKNTGFGFIKGGVRGSSMYVLSNFTTTPTFVASAVATASFGVAEQMHLHRNGKLTDLELIESSELLCLEASVSALSSILGQVAIPVPILGSIIGNTIGNIMYQISKNHFDEKEQQLLNQFIEEQAALDKSLSEKYKQYINLLNQNMNAYLSLLDQAFVPNVEVAFNGSIMLSRYLGIDSSEILSDLDSIDSYFMS